MRVNAEKTPVKSGVVQDLRQLEGTRAGESRVAEQAVHLGRASDAGSVLLRLQRERGNRYVQRLVRPARRGDTGTGRSFDGRAVIQPKLMVTAAGDRQEREADRITRQVVRQDGPGIPESSASVGMQSLRAAAGGMDVAPQVEAGVRRARGGGQALPASVRLPLELASGADFHGARVHPDGAADTLNRVLNTRAFTTGQNIFLRRREFSPGSNRYVQRLLRDARSEAADAPITMRNEDDAVRRANTTGMPDDLKSGIEDLSALSLDDVKIHYNSSKPAQLHALAYTKGTNIYLGPGQVGHLPHEAWHVVQQKQGRVRKVKRSHSGINVSDDPVLEREADRYGYSAPRIVSERSARIPGHGGATPSADGPIQCRMGLEFETGLVIQNPENYSYGDVLIEGASGWEAIFDSGNLEIRTSPDDSYGSLDATMQDVEQFIALVKDHLKEPTSAALHEVAKSPSNKNAFHCTGAGAKTTITRKPGDNDIQLVVKEKTRQENEVSREIMNLVSPGPTVKTREEFEEKQKALSLETKKKVEALQRRGKELQSESRDLHAQPQVTFGVPLRKIHLMLNKAVNTPLLTYGKQFEEAKTGKAPPRLIPRPIIDSDVIRQRISGVKLESDEAHDQYLGFLSLVCLYVKRGMLDAALAGAPPDYVKSYFDVMSRTDFNSIYQLLSPVAQKHFRDEGEDVVIGIVRSGAADLAKAAWGDERPKDTANRNVLSRGVRGGKIGPTLGQWIESIHDPGFRDSDRLETTEYKYTSVRKKGKLKKGENPWEQRQDQKTVPSQFAEDLKTRYVDVDKQLMQIPDIQKKLEGRKPLANRDLLSRGEVLNDSQSMGLLGLDRADPAFPGGTLLVLLEFRGIQGELFSRYWRQLAKQLYEEFRFIRNYDFQNAQLPEAGTAAGDLEEFLKVFLRNPGAAWRGTTVNPWQFWRVAVTNRYFYNLLRSLLSAT